MMKRGSEEETKDMTDDEDDTGRMKRPKGIRRKNHRVSLIEHFSQKQENDIVVNSSCNWLKTTNQIVDCLDQSEICRVFAHSDDIPDAFAIVQKAIEILFDRYDRIYRINIPGTIKAIEVWEDRRSKMEVWRRVVHRPVIVIDISSRPLPSRHIGYQVYEKVQRDYIRPKKKYREREDGSKPKLQRIE